MEIKIIIKNNILEKEFNSMGLLCDKKLIIEFKEWMEKDWQEWYKDNLKSFLIEKAAPQKRG